MFNRRRKQHARKKPAKQGGIRGFFTSLKAKYDAAQTTADNRRHWANADHLSPNASVNPQVRRELRSRARYEVANNGYARGLVNSVSNYVVGTGTRLQVKTGDGALDRVIEREFHRWAKKIKLFSKLRTMRMAQMESGECFGILVDNPNLPDIGIRPVPVTLDLRLVEADMVTAPVGTATLDDRYVDGIWFDGFGNPISYDILRRHPGEANGPLSDRFRHDTIAARSVIHLFRADRPGQSRGVPEISPSLPLYAQLRRYTYAVLQSAENAALISGVIHSDAPALDEDPDPVETFDEVELERGLFTTMPAGWKMSQMRAEQPTTMYGDFKNEIINESARPADVPRNIATGNSSGYNYASGRLDYQAFWKAVSIDRQRLEEIVLDRVFWAWFNEAVLIEGYLPQSLRTLDVDLTHQWFWDGIEHVDPAKESNAQSTRLKSRTTTLAAEYAKQGQDWETELHQIAREQELMRELGITIEDAAPLANQQEEEEDEAETEASGKEAA